MKNLLTRLQRAQVHTKLRAAVGDRVLVRAQLVVAPVFRRSLTALARVYWSDKAGGHDYTRIYENICDPCATNRSVSSR